MRPSFEAALEDVQRKDGDKPQEARPVVVPPPSLPLPEAESPGSASAAHSLWEFAAAWTPEADPPPPRPAPPPVEPAPKPSAKPEDVAQELCLDQLTTLADLMRARRRFMWDNHPDRRKDLDRDLANRRVAIANMLLDRALVDLRRRLSW